MVRPPQTGKIREGRSFVVETDSVVVATELGLPEYDDVSTAPQTQNRLVYATGDGPSAEGIYKHDGSTYAQVGGGGTGQWEEDGSGAIVPIDGETVGDGTTEADHNAVETDQATIDGHRVYIQSTEPSSPSNNDIWFDLP
jgi:hypothetical protein